MSEIMIRPRNISFVDLEDARKRLDLIRKGNKKDVILLIMDDGTDINNKAAEVLYYLIKIADIIMRYGKYIVLRKLLLKMIYLILESDDEDDIKIEEVNYLINQLYPGKFNFKLEENTSDK